ncbi:sensor histidine kinase [Ectobacillus sp. sgz5001026]|uniref:sensor histidine kinase n=1 Tax=Ectobacillus sp. sgz5001026 TaxID=3242473 RepID=UPI0036D214A5
MLKKYWNLLKRTGISPYIWTVLAILPFYFILQSSSTFKIVFGIVITILFLLIYRIAYIAKGWAVYVWTCILIGISVLSISLFSYVYFAFFLAYFIGTIKDKVPFLTLYFIHLVSTAIVINFSIILHEDQIVKQLPFVLVILISVILLPLSLRYRKERGQLEEKLEDANKKIADLVKQEERQRIARDLHDTLGQKLSLIGLKSDLARKLVYSNPEQARAELKDVQQTARTALNEVRKMVANMRGLRLKDEMIRVKQILQAAQINIVFEQDLSSVNVSLLTENILSMCLKEAVTNVVKHSKAKNCYISLVQTSNETIIKVRDDGITLVKSDCFNRGSGLTGMRERLEFVNGSLEIVAEKGTILIIKVPNVVKISEREEFK